MSTLEFFETEVHRITNESAGVLSLDCGTRWARRCPHWAPGPTSTCCCPTD